MVNVTVKKIRISVRGKEILASPEILCDDRTFYFALVTKSNYDNYPTELWNSEWIIALRRTAKETHALMDGADYRLLYTL
jgi:hypothetical protein